MSSREDSQSQSHNGGVNFHFHDDDDGNSVRTESVQLVSIAVNSPPPNNVITVASDAPKKLTKSPSVGEEKKETAMDGQSEKSPLISTTTASSGKSKDKENKPKFTGIEGDENTPVQQLTVQAVARRFATEINMTDVKRSQGLTVIDAKMRLEKDGPNVLTPPKTTPEWLKYLLQYTDYFMLMLMGAGTLSCIAYGLDKTQPINLWIGIVLFVVVVISATFAYVQEGKAASVMAAFKNLLPPKANVIREGKLQQVPAADLVVGDLLQINGGDQCPADVRIVAIISDIKYDLSSLTGESVPIGGTVFSEEKIINEAKNIMFNTCQVQEGEVLAVVIATGDDTYIGHIAKLASDNNSPPTPMQKEIIRFVRNLTIFSLCMGICFFVIAAARSQPLIQAFINGFIVVMIANVPEGLPATVVTCLAITGRRMADLHVNIKQLSSVETLGSASVIASDKTGTLTQNKMSVSRLWFDLSPMTVETVYRDLGPSLLTASYDQLMKSSGNQLTLYALERIAAVCSRTRFKDMRDLSDEEAQTIEQSNALRSLDPSMTLRSAKAAFPTFLSSLDSNLTINSAKRQAFSAIKDDMKREIIGDASETALFNFIKARQSVELARYHNRVVFDVPFNSRNKYALSIMKPYRIPGNKNHKMVLLMKGAPEIIMARCDKWMNRGKVQPIDEEFQKEFTKAYEMFGGFGERVLGFAQLELDEKEYPSEMASQFNANEENYPTTGLVFVGLISLVDPPKETVPGAIEACRTAGVRVVMVTGDHPITAKAIARQVGIITGPTREDEAKARGVDIEEINDDEIDSVVVAGSSIPKAEEDTKPSNVAWWDRVLSKNEIVFARTTPAQKSQIVKNFMRLGNIVAATGDGVNDSPALRQADIGVAMGISGSDVARNAADVILMDDDFSSIVVGIREGRTIFDNLTKTVAYTVTHMPPEVLPILFNLAFGLPLGMSAILILCIDCGTELFPAVSLAYEKAEADVMSRPPRNPQVDKLVTLKTVTYWYALAGLWETLVCLLNFFLVFNYYCVPPSSLVLSDKYWVSDADPFTTSCGDVYDDTKQLNILHQAQTAWWLALTGSQFFHIWMCKTRVLSLWDHGLFHNMQMNYGVLIELGFMLIVIFVPAHDFFQSEIPPGFSWAIVLVGWAGLFLLNEPRKWAIRKYKGKNKVVDFLAW